MDKNPQTIFVFIGSTASGKSAAAIKHAQAVANGVVINMDSMQVYRDLFILTARPSMQDMQTVPHRLYGFRPASQPLNAASYAAIAVQEIQACFDLGQTPILVGGTGMYLKSLLEGFSPMPDVPEAVREAAITRHAELGAEAFHAEVATFDPSLAAKRGSGDTQRLQRAWEVYHASNIPLSEWQSQPKQGAAPDHWQFDVTVLEPDREALRQRIDARFEHMIEQGALDEVAALKAQGLPTHYPAMRAHGVPPLCQHLDGELSLQEAIEIGQRDTRHYARRQRTWIRHQLLGKGAGDKRLQLAVQSV